MFSCCCTPPTPLTRFVEHGFDIENDVMLWHWKVQLELAAFSSRLEAPSFALEPTPTPTLKWPQTELPLSRSGTECAPPTSWSRLRSYCNAARQRQWQRLACLAPSWTNTEVSCSFSWLGQQKTHFVCLCEFYRMSTASLFARPTLARGKSSKVLLARQALYNKLNLCKLCAWATRILSWALKPWSVFSFEHVSPLRVATCLPILETQVENHQQQMRTPIYSRVQFGVIVVSE